MDAAPSEPRRHLGWSSVWVRAGSALGAWLALATFFYVTTPADLRTSDQAAVMLAWGFVGAAFGCMSHLGEGYVARFLISRFASVRRRKVIAFFLSMLFVVVMVGTLTILDTDQGGSAWSIMALMAFFAALAVPSSPFLSRLQGTAPPPPPAT